MKKNNKHSQLFLQTIGLIYPLIIIFSLYIIYNGHNSPGGGFQGGAILSTAFIVNYLAHNEMKLSLSFLNRLEKILYLALVMLGSIFVLYLTTVNQDLKYTYLIIMNFLIGIKVACGLTVIFYRYIFFESR